MFTVDDIVVKLTFDGELRPSKHFRNTWLRKWDWDMRELRAALQSAHKVERVGKHKYEAYTRYGTSRSRKIVLAVQGDAIYIITGAEGK